MTRETWHRQWRRLLAVWAVLLALMLLSLGVAYLPIGAGWKAAAGLLIAGVKASIVVLVFMQLGRHHPLARLALAVALWTLLVMGVLSGVDYLTRQHDPARVQVPGRSSPAVLDQIADPAAPRTP